MQIVFPVLLAHHIAAGVLPTNAPSDGLIGNHSATFETVNDSGPIASPVAGLPGPYEALNWTGIAIPPYCSRYCAVYPYSFPLYAAFYAASPASASADYRGSKVLAFDLFDFAYGCSANRSFQIPPGSGSPLYVDAPVNCTLAVKGWRGAATGIPAASTTIAYIPQQTPGQGGPPQAQQTVFSVAGFRGLRNVHFEARLGTNTVQTFGNFKGLIDSVHYRVYNYTL